MLKIGIILALFAFLFQKAGFAQADELYACELCVLQDEIYDLSHAIKYSTSIKSSDKLVEEPAQESFVFQQKMLDSTYEIGLDYFKVKLKAVDSANVVKGIHELCFDYKFNTEALKEKTRDSLIEIYSWKRYQDLNVYNYETFPLELNNLLPEFDSTGAPLEHWKTTHSFSKKGFLGMLVYTLWYESYSPKEWKSVDKWKLAQLDSLDQWNVNMRSRAVTFMGWHKDDEAISDAVLFWKMDYYLSQKIKRDYLELRRRFFEEEDAEAYRQLLMIHFEMSDGDEKSLELYLYAANNYHWPHAFADVFSSYWIIYDQEQEDYLGLPADLRQTMEAFLIEGVKYNCTECSQMLESIEKWGSPYRRR